MDNVNQEQVLDNPIFNALTTGNRVFSEGDEQLYYFQTAVAPFVGMAAYTAETFELLQQVPVAGADFFIVFTTEETEIPHPWKLLAALPLYQMVYTGPLLTAQTDSAIVPLTEKDVPAMLALTQLTNPGPFRQRTIELGNYTGIFADGELVAMAGQRLQPLPYIEVSAVCTHPQYVGRGYAGRLIKEQVRRIQQQGGIPFLHSKQDNTGAIHLYEKLGFSIRRVNYAYMFALTV